MQNFAVEREEFFFFIIRLFDSSPMQSEIFPLYAIKQALKELDIERDDDAILTIIQDEILPHCACILVKHSVVSSIHNKRKFLGANDIQYAMSTILLPKGEILSENVGYLMDTKHFGKMAYSLMKIILSSFEKSGLEIEEKKISYDCILTLQSATECLVRGVLLYYKQRKIKSYDYKLLYACMDELFGMGRGDITTFRPCEM